MKNFPIVNNKMETNENTYIDPHYNCNRPEKNFIQKISYQSITSSYFSHSCGIIDVNLSSACIRCEMCLAIAQQINQTLIDIHESMIPLLWLNETEASNLLRTICNDSFKHFSLRSLNGNYQICDRQPGATLVTTSVDGLWEKHLRNKCHHYLDEMNPIRLYEQWKKWCDSADDEQGAEDLSTTLCRDDTTFFRDCKSIEENDYKKPNAPSEDFETHVKILAEIKWK
ncbi:marginal zone B- and B1-cell-specific protein-like [Leptopilina boulardi]|uniref:marginal zone B- and B1-cell-specific protein-like n=1 Tax=Leptopilina boulardi TaxID=63433 RepID=UPI0021F68B2C|nr:marginal zone B- and B1-cell-specific protein-like [Leptopilina boulardi]